MYNTYSSGFGNSGMMSSGMMSTFGRKTDTYGEYSGELKNGKRDG